MTKELLLHLKQHNQKRKCNNCRWATFYRKWATALPLVPPTLEHEPEFLQGWTELHDKEAAFQQSKREKRKFEALAYGALLPRSALRSSKRLRIRLHAASAAWRARQRRDNILQPVQPSQQTSEAIRSSCAMSASLTACRTHA